LGFSRKIVILIIMFLSFALANYVFKPSASYPYKGTRVITNFHVNGWRDVDLPNADNILKALETDSTIFKRFTSADGKTVSLYIGHYKKLDKAKLSHSPKVCFTAQGWIMSNPKHISLSVGKYMLNCTAMIVQKDNNKELVYYWYQFDDKTFADLYKMKLALLSKKLRHAKEDNLFIRLTSPVSDGDKKAAAVILGFYKSLYPEVMKCFFAGN